MQVRRPKLPYIPSLPPRLENKNVPGEKTCGTSVVGLVSCTRRALPRGEAQKWQRRLTVTLLLSSASSLYISEATTCKALIESWAKQKTKMVNSGWYPVGGERYYAASSLMELTPTYSSTGRQKCEQMWGENRKLWADSFTLFVDACYNRGGTILPNYCGRIDGASKLRTYAIPLE